MTTHYYIYSIIRAKALLLVAVAFGLLPLEVNAQTYTSYVYYNDSYHLGLRSDSSIPDTLEHTVVVDAAEPVTCTSVGKTEGWHCADCGHVFATQATILCSGHYYENGICTQTEGETHYEEPTLTTSGYALGNAGNLIWFANKVNSGDNTLCALLSADITLNTNLYKGSTYNASASHLAMPVINNYAGTFDGRGHSITGLYINETETQAALFDTMSGTIQGLTLRNAYIDTLTTAAYLCGTNLGTISQCGMEGRMQRGRGLCLLNEGTITDCYSTAIITSDDYPISVFAVENDGEVSNCFNAGSMKSASDEAYAIAPGTVTNCYYVNTLTPNAGEQATQCTYNELIAGKVCFLLNGERNKRTPLWRQTLNTDQYPTVSASHQAVSQAGDIYYNVDAVDQNGDGFISVGDLALLVKKLGTTGQLNIFTLSADGQSVRYSETSQLGVADATDVRNIVLSGTTPIAVRLDIGGNGDGADAETKADKGF